jgi:c(7)-type cytochrome triheme protein
MDVELTSSGQPDYKVTFKHKPHTQWMGCPLCHAGLFEMEKGKAKLTMADMGAGKQCGVCHGKVAAPELSSCPDCHPPAKK